MPAPHIGRQGHLRKQYTSKPRQIADQRVTFIGELSRHDVWYWYMVYYDRRGRS